MERKRTIFIGILILSIILAGLAGADDAQTKANQKKDSATEAMTNVEIHLQNKQRQLMPVGTKYLISFPGGVVGPHVMKEKGLVREEVKDSLSMVTIYWGAPELLDRPDAPHTFDGVDWAFKQDVHLNEESEDSGNTEIKKNQALLSLSSLNYPDNQVASKRVLAFQRDYCFVFSKKNRGNKCMKRSGKLDEITIDAILEVGKKGLEAKQGNCDACDRMADDADDHIHTDLNNGIFLYVKVVSEKDHVPIPHMYVETDNQKHKPVMTNANGVAAIQCFDTGKLLLSVKDKEGRIVSTPKVKEIVIDPLITRGIAIEARID